MSSNTDTQFAARFSDLTASTYVANQTTLANFTPTTSLINTGMLSDIGRATIYGPEYQDSFWNKFMKAPLGRGDAVMTARFSGVKSGVYSPTAAYDTLFSASNPTMVSNVAKKNLSRQVAVEVNDRYLAQMAQVPEMIGDASAAIMAASNACYMNDMWVGAKEYFSGSTRSMTSNQYKILTNGVTEAGFGDEMIEALWDFSQNKFGYLSEQYNVSGIETRSPTVAIAMNKACEYPAFKKLLSETFNPEFLRIVPDGGIDFVDTFATPAGKPEGAGDLLAIVVDPRAYEITPMPEALSTEAFRNPARKATAYFTTYEYAFQDNPFFNKAFIYAPSE